MHDESFHERNLIICEGEADNEFLKALLAERGIVGFQVTNPANGKHGFGTRLRAIRANRGYANIDRILLVRDNDDDPSGSFRDMKSQIRDAQGYGIPRAPLASTRRRGEPRVAVMMLPWIREEGCLETLLLRVFSHTWPDKRRCADEYLECIGVANLPVASHSKMVLRCVIASVLPSEPDISLRYLWSKHRDLRRLLAHKSFTPIVDFLQSFVTQ